MIIWMKAAIPCGIGKINVDTDIRLAVTRNMKEFFHNYPEKRNSPSIGGVYKLLEEKKDQFDPRAFLPPIMDTVMYGNVPDEDVAALVAVIEKGVKEADFTFYDAEGYVGEKKQICSSDEALLTVMYEIKSISDMPNGTYIEKIERGYDFSNENDIADISVIKLVPCYRIYV